MGQAYQGYDISNSTKAKSCIANDMVIGGSTVGEEMYFFKNWKENAAIMDNYGFSRRMDISSELRANHGNIVSTRPPQNPFPKNRLNVLKQGKIKESNLKVSQGANN